MAQYSETDIAIAGGGMVGISLARLLARALPDCRITLVEAFPLKRNASAAAVDDTPSFDARSTALSHSSRRLFEQLGLWSRLSERCTPIHQIHVSDRGHPGSTRLAASEQKLPALGYVVENRWLGRILTERLAATPGIELLAPAQVAGVQATQRGMQLTFADGREPLLAGLLVAADGADSAICTQLGIARNSSDYQQLGLIANLGLARSHNNIAYERFTDQGPIALLPLPPVEGQSRAALVWTLPQTTSLRDCGKQEFLAQLQQRFGHRAGIFEDVGERHTYPLRLTIAAEQVRRNLVVVGNAAHSLHPVAGQGFNLALRDCAILAGTLAEGVADGAAVGELAVLQRYAERRRSDQQRTILLSDLLPKSFAQRNPALVFARNLSLLAMEVTPPLRSGFSDLGMGLWERIDNRAAIAGANP